MNRFIEIFVIETLTRAFEEKNAKKAENSTRMPSKAWCGQLDTVCRVVDKNAKNT